MSATSSSLDNWDWQTSLGLLTDRSEYLFQTGIFSDCVFVLQLEHDQQVLRAHKTILAMSSPVFAAMFFGGMPEQEMVSITDVHPDAFRALLQFIYTDTVSISSFDHACDICYAATKYMLPYLVEECIRYINSKLNSGNACKAYEFGFIMGLQDLTDSALSFICECTEQVIQASSFNDARLNTILTVFERDDLNIDTELDLFLAISRYSAQFDETEKVTKDDREVNRVMIREIVKKIRFRCLNLDEFARFVGPSELLTVFEKNAIFANICSVELDTPMPEGFSTSYTPRQCARNMSESGNVLFYCTRRQVLGNWSFRDNSCHLRTMISFSCNKCVTIYGIQIATRVLPRMACRNICNLLYSYISDRNGVRLTYAYFQGELSNRPCIEIIFNRPIVIVKNKKYKLGLKLHKTLLDMIITRPYENNSICNHGTLFRFQTEDSYSDMLVETIIFSHT